MIITCDECNSSFSVNDSLIKDTGSKVRCSKCDSIFVAYPQPVEETETLPIAEDDDLGLDDLDADLGDFLGEDETDEALTAASDDVEETELELNDFDDTLGGDTGLALDEAGDEAPGELELNLDFDQEGELESVLEEASTTDGDLPELDELEDLADLDGDLVPAEESDSDLEGLDLELETENDAELEIQGEDDLDLTDLSLEAEDSDDLEMADLDFEAEDGADLDLTDLGLEEEENSALEEPATEAAQAVEAPEAGDDELDLSDLEAAIDDDSALDGNVEAAAEKLDLDQDIEEPAQTEVSGSDSTDQVSDDLNLSDLDLELDDTPVAEQAASGESADLDLDLDLEAETVSSAAEDGYDELELSDITDIMEEPEEPAAETQPEELDLELELDGISDSGSDESAAVAESSGTDELDLSDLEGIMNNEETPAADATTDKAIDDQDLDLDLQIEEGDKSAESAAAPQDSDELDFSDLEHMLESDETPSVETPENDNDQELDLEFDLDSAPAAEADEAVAEPAAADIQEDEFLDIDQLLEEGEDSSSPVEAELNGDVTDLPLEMEAALDDASKGAEAELELDFDLESELQAGEDLFETEGETEGEGQLESNLLDSDDLDFLEEAGIEEADFQDESETSVVATDEFQSEVFTDSGDANGATDVLPLSEAENPATETFDVPPPAAHEPPKRSRSKKPVLVVLLLLVLGLGVVTVPNMLGIKIPYLSDIKIPYLSDMDVKIPYLSDWLNPEPQDVAGNLKIIPLGNTINGRFVANSKTGQLFVIQGQVKNDYDHPRSYIKVTAKLYQKGNKIAKQSTVYVGNTLSNSDLTGMDMVTISKKLRIRTGQKKSNFKVKTGNRVPFMIVFDKLPRNLDEYTVEVESSSI